MVIPCTLIKRLHGFFVNEVFEQPEQEQEAVEAKRFDKFDAKGSRCYVNRL
jgi:hypothetical protein